MNACVVPAYNTNTFISNKPNQLFSNTFISNNQLFSNNGDPI